MPDTAGVEGASCGRWLSFVRYTLSLTTALGALPSQWLADVSCRTSAGGTPALPGSKSDAVDHHSCLIHWERRIYSAEVRRGTLVADVDVGAPSGLSEGTKDIQWTFEALSRMHAVSGGSAGSAAVSAADARRGTLVADMNVGAPSGGGERHLAEVWRVYCGRHLLPALCGGGSPIQHPAPPHLSR